MDDDAARHISREGLAALEAELRELELDAGLFAHTSSGVASPHRFSLAWASVAKCPPNLTTVPYCRRDGAGASQARARRLASRLPRRGPARRVPSFAGGTPAGHACPEPGTRCWRADGEGPGSH